MCLALTTSVSSWTSHQSIRCSLPTSRAFNTWSMLRLQRTDIETTPCEAALLQTAGVAVKYQSNILPHINLLQSPTYFEVLVRFKRNGHLKSFPRSSSFPQSPKPGLTSLASECQLHTNGDNVLGFLERGERRCFHRECRGYRRAV